MYTFESRVRFSEADHTELLTLPGLVNYFQDSFCMADCSKPLSETRGIYQGVHLGNGFYRTFRTS